MASIIRPTRAQGVRRLIVLAAALLAVAVAYGQMALGWGQTPQEFAAGGDSTLRVAGYAFSIWGLIYLGLLAYAVRQALPATGESEVLSRLGWPSAVALIGIGLWIVAAAADAKLATNLLIFGSAAVLLASMAGHARRIRALPGGDRDRWLTVWPLGLLAGWLTIAAPVNLLTTATETGLLPEGLSPTGWAVLAVAVASLLTVAMTATIRISAFALPFAWGLFAVFAAEQDRNPALAFTALGAAVLVLIATVILVLRREQRIERPG